MNKTNMQSSNNVELAEPTIPDEFVCPISMEIMTQPVIGNDGYTYEKLAIEQWLSTNTKSPMTRVLMTVQDLTPNFSLRHAIERWRKDHPDTVYAPPKPLPSPPKQFDVIAHQDDQSTLLEIRPMQEKPMETTLIAIIDTSGSMDFTASNKPVQEGSALSRLDLVKHSLKTLATMLQECQKSPCSLGMVGFSDNATIQLPITAMTPTSLPIVYDAIQQLKAQGGTNLWDGIRQGLDLAKEQLQKNPTNNIQILLLTDGEPTQDYLPPLGIDAMLTRKLKALPGRVTISTFGFGYSLDCDLLENICLRGNGSYGFIPDCSMVGTVFINWTAKALLTISHHMEVKLPDGSIHQLGDCVQGLSQTLLLPPMELATIELRYDHDQAQIASVTRKSSNNIKARMLDRLRKAVLSIKRHKNTSTISGAELDYLHEETKKSPYKLLKDIARDIESQDANEGQLKKAIHNQQWWESWGRNHYISYARALTLQQCVNFKDNVLQHFASATCKKLQEKGIDIFGDLPPPVPTSYADLSYASASASASASMIQGFSLSQLVNAAGGCFTGDSLAQMEDSTTEYVKNIRPGDVVYEGYKVQAVIKTVVEDTIPMVLFNTGLGITPWHPMLEKGEWVFPCRLDPPVKTYVKEYYNFVLDKGHIVNLNGFYVATLAHGFTSNLVIQHPYFGTNKVLEDLQQHPDWKTGYIVLEAKDTHRDPATGLVTGLMKKN